jgi:hypothetical protein
MVTDAGDDRLDGADIPTSTARTSPTYPSVIDGSRELFEKSLPANLRRQPRRHALIGPKMGAGDRRCVISFSSAGAIRSGSRYMPSPPGKVGRNVLTVGLVYAPGPAAYVKTVLARPIRTGIPAIRDMAHFRRRPRPGQLHRAGKRGRNAGPAHCFGCRGSSHATGATLAVSGDEP